MNELGARGLTYRAKRSRDYVRALRGAHPFLYNISALVSADEPIRPAERRLPSPNLARLTKAEVEEEHVMITVSGGQSHTVSSGQTETGDFILRGGTLNVLSGATVSNTINSAGVENVYGTDVGAIISGTAHQAQGQATQGRDSPA